MIPLLALSLSSNCLVGERSELLNDSNGLFGFLFIRNFDALYNKVFIPNFGLDTITVLDGNTDTIAAVILAVESPHSIGVDSPRDLLYVSSSNGNGLYIIDGITNEVIVPGIAVGTTPRGVAVNSRTNRIYVANNGSNTVTVVDGATYAILATVPVGSGPEGVAVNEETNRIYVTNGSANTVSVLDGSSNTVILAAISFGSFSGMNSPVDIAVDSVNNLIFVADQYGGGNGTVDTIDGITNIQVAESSLNYPTIYYPNSLAFDQTRGRLYIGGWGGSGFAAINPITGAYLSEFATGADPFGAAVNEQTNKVYFVDENDETITVVSGDNVANTITSFSLDVGAAPTDVAVLP